MLFMQPILKSCLRPLACTLALLGAVAKSQPLPVNNTSVVNEIRSLATNMSSPEFSELRESTSRQSAAIAQSAQNSPRQYNAQLLDSPVVGQFAQASAEENRTIEKSVGPEQMRQAQITLPSSFNVFASELKNGKFVTVSDRGPEIIVLIRQLSLQNQKDRLPILKRIQAYSAKGYPEATNFIGMIFEYGLFNTPRDINMAASFYKAAAQRRYQPALYNLAGIAFFGKTGRASPAEAEQLLSIAASLGPEPSFRVCGLASFLQYRQGKKAEALAYAKNCRSPLASLANAGYGVDFTVQERFKMLREAIGAGADDGFPLLVGVAKAIPDDKNFMFCKYHLINQIRFAPVPPGLREAATNCHAEAVRLTPSLNIPTRQRTAVNLMGKSRSAQAPGPSGSPHHEMAIMGITGFVSSEAGALSHLRKSNRFHHSWSVPFLPFGQAEVNLFQPIMPRGR